LIVRLADLVDLLEKHATWGSDTPPHQALAIDFDGPDRTVKDTLTFPSVGGGTLALDVDDKGRVVSIEII
jgi:hypothetical protein